MPKVSVVMSVYNSEKYLEMAIDSITKQTFKDFEFIIINDGSTDGSFRIIKSAQEKDKRIIVINRENKGLIYSLNEGISSAKGEYIARMDADDVAHPSRLERQISVMEENQDIALCGTWAEKIDENGNKKGVYNFPPTEHKKIKKYAILHNPFIHPTTLFKLEAIKKIGMYNPEFKHAEDYELWTRFIVNFKTHNIPEYLLLYRITSTGITKSKNISMRIAGIKARWQYLKLIIKKWKSVPRNMG